MVKGREYVEKSLALDSQYHLALILITGIGLETGSYGKSLLNMYFWKAIT